MGNSQGTLANLQGVWRIQNDSIKAPIQLHFSVKGTRNCSVMMMKPQVHGQISASVMGMNCGFRGEWKPEYIDDKNIKHGPLIRVDIYCLDGDLARHKNQQHHHHQSTNTGTNNHDGNVMLSSEEPTPREPIAIAHVNSIFVAHQHHEAHEMVKSFDSMGEGEEARHSYEFRPKILLFSDF